MTLEEFVCTLKPPIEIRKEYKKIMENAKIENPLELEEKILDLYYRGKELEKEVKAKRGEYGPVVEVKKDRTKTRNPIEILFTEKIKKLETDIIQKNEDEE